MNNRNSEILKFAKFLCVGGITFCVHTLALWVFKRRLGYGDVLSSVLAYLPAVSVHFTLNNIFTFRDSTAGYKRRLLGYAFTAGCSYVIAVLVNVGTLKYIYDSVLLATALSTCCTTAFTYSALSRVFSGRRR
jgi:putative flippase GtrA